MKKGCSNSALLASVKLRKIFGDGPGLVYNQNCRREDFERPEHALSILKALRRISCKADVPGIRHFEGTEPYSSAANGLFVYYAARKSYK